MRVRLNYSVRSFLDLSWIGLGRVVLSPYDMESLVVDGAVAQPRVTLAGQEAGEWVLEAPCESPVVVSKDRVVCGATGFSHTEYGVAVKRELSMYKLVTKSQELEGEHAVWASAPGAFAVALFDGRETHLALADFTGLRVYESVYSKKPLKCSLGYKLTACVFEDLRSVVVPSRGEPLEVGFPAEAVALTQHQVALVRAAGWLVYAVRDDPRPVLRTQSPFVGFARGGLPAFLDGGKVKVLDSGALVDYAELEIEGSSATAWGIVVEDSGTSLRVIDELGREALVVPKDSEASCWATRQGVLCCRGLRCALVEPGDGLVVVEPLFDGEHKVRLVADVPLLVHYGGRTTACGEKCEVVDEAASVLKDHAFHLELEHLLGSVDVAVTSKAPRPAVAVREARLYVSDGVHECGGLTYFRAYVEKVFKPPRVKVLVGGVEISEGSYVEVCGEWPEVHLRAVDPVAADSLDLGKLEYEVVRVPRPAVSIRVERGSGSSRVELDVEGGVEVVEVKLCCSRRCASLDTATRVWEVKDCRAPARLLVRTKKHGFAFTHSLEVPPTPKLLECLEEGFTRQGEVVVCSDAGLVASYVSPEFPDVPPIGRLSVRILPRGMELLFTSRALARALILCDSTARATQLKPGETSIEVPFAERLALVVDSGRLWRYAVRIPVELLLRAAVEHARSIIRSTPQLREALASSGDAQAVDEEGERG
ncbi:MAG: hypothetical protein QW498_07775 [Thermofilum sp.]